MSRKTRARLAGLATHAFLIAAALVVLVPFYWMTVTALKPFADIFAIPPKWLPDTLDLSAFRRVFGVLPFGTMMFNSAKIAVFGTIGQLVSCSLAGYAVARLPFFGRRPLFFAILLSMLVPYQVVMIPIFVIMKNLGLIDNQLSLILPTYLGGALGIFLMRQFFLTLPRELEDAASIDGANPFQIFLWIILPLSRPALTALAVVSFTALWNDLLTPLIYLSKTELQTLPVGMSTFTGQHGTEWNLLMAAALLSVIPAFIIFLVAQRQLVSGISLGSAVKG
jgi:multiple sugar transport system permease protein